MAGLPKNFDAISNVLANYNFVDIASGTGYINFYSGKTVDLNLLSNYSYYSDTVKTTVTFAAGVHTDTLRIDNDFDVLINRPLDIKGIGIVNIPISPSTAGSNTVGAYAIATLRKWNGVTETDIVTNTSITISAHAGGATTAYGMLAVDLNIPLTHFKIGEYLRLTIAIYSNNDSGAVGGGVAFAHDPKSRTVDWDTTGAVPSQLIFQCPVRLNL